MTTRISEEKAGFSSAIEEPHVHNSDHHKSEAFGDGYDPEFTEEEQRKIWHRIDRRLISTCGVLYCFSLLDRTNLGAASIAGMTAELELNVGYRYSIIALVFFVTYTVFQPPATILCRKIGPRNFITFIVVTWGAITLIMGFMKSWIPLVILRLFLGVLEAGFFPGCVYLISTWYRRYDLQKRYGVFYIIGTVASAFSGILGYGIMQMAGVAGYLGWSWIFIILGILTIVLGIGGWFTLVDFPDKAHKTAWSFITEKECAFVLRQINRDRQDAELEPFRFKAWASAGLDLKIWGFALIFFSLTTVSYSLANFLPIILNLEMGFDVDTSLCLIAPPYVFAGIMMFFSAWLGDKYRVRGPVLIGNCIMTLVGLPIMGFHGNQGVRYFGVFLVAAGTNSNLPCCMAYQGNNIRGQWKRAFCSASLVGFGGIGGIAGSLVFRAQDAPGYAPGIWACIACQCLVIVVVCINTFYFMAQNKKAAKGEIEIEGLAGFRYTL